MPSLKVFIQGSEERRRVSLQSTAWQDVTATLSSMFGLGDVQKAYLIKYVDDEGDLVTVHGELDWAEALAQFGPAGSLIKLTLVPVAQQPSSRVLAKQALRDARAANRKNSSKRSSPSKRGIKACKPQHAKCPAAAAAARAARAGCCKRRHGGPQLAKTVPVPPQPQAQQATPAVAAPRFPLAQMLSGLVSSNPVMCQMLNGALGSDFVKVEHNATCDGCNGRISGNRFKCTVCPDFDFCQACHATKAAAHGHDWKVISPLEALQQFLGGQSGNMVLDAFLAPGKATDPSPKVVHTAICDACDAGIEGIRWKCADCPDFDLCNSCMKLDQVMPEHKADHTFVAITDPKQQHLPSSPCSPVASASPSVDAGKQESAQEQPLMMKLRTPEPVVKQPMQPLMKLRTPEPIVKQPEPVVKQPEPVTESMTVEHAVEEAQEEPEEAEPEREATPFERNLQTLSDMGFTDLPTNIKLLVKHKGALFPTIQELLAGRIHC